AVVVKHIDPPRISQRQRRLELRRWIVGAQNWCGDDNRNSQDREVLMPHSSDLRLRKSPVWPTLSPRILALDHGKYKSVSCASPNRDHPRVRDPPDKSRSYAPAEAKYSYNDRKAPLRRPRACKIVSHTKASPSTTFCSNPGSVTYSRPTSM